MNLWAIVIDVLCFFRRIARRISNGPAIKKRQEEKVRGGMYFKTFLEVK